MYGKTGQWSHKFTVASLTIMLLTSTSMTAFAQQANSNGDEDDEVLEQIVVTGSRIGKSVDKIPGAINIISQLDIQRNSVLTSDVTSLLTRTVPGYSESRQQMSNSGETLRGRIALRLFDGVPQGSPLREVNRSGIFTDMGVIERVEVINGPSASEGIGGAGGIINYISRSPTEEGTEVRASVLTRSQFEDDSMSWNIGFNVAHKEDAFDALFSGSFSENGIAYDGHGVRIGLGRSGSSVDTRSNNFFLKLGKNFGRNDTQRLEVAISDFQIRCQCNYFLVRGDRDLGITHTSVKGRPLGAQASFNDFSQQSLTYTNTDIFGGSLWVQYYDASQAMRFEAENELDKQDPLIAPIPLGLDGLPVSDLPLIEQSEMNSQKKGLRSSWTKVGLFSLPDLELQVGIDIVEDIAQQTLALTNRLWVPPMEYTSVAPFLQLSYDIGPVTLTAGLRSEDGELHVNDYTTVWNRDRRFVNGGTIDYQETMPNIGAIWRVTDQWSIFVSLSEGFTLPNVGIPLRNISCQNDTPESGSAFGDPFGGTQPDGCPNDPPIGVDGILDLNAIVVENAEIGFSWRGERGSVGASYYQSDSEFGVSLRVDPITEDYIMLRRPTEVKGYEFSATFNVTDEIMLNAMYSHTEGLTRRSDEGPLDREMGVRDIGPDKIVLGASWGFSDKASVIFGARTMLDNDINEGASGEEHINGYTLLDLTAIYELQRGTVSFGIDNLTDEYYILASSQPGGSNYYAGRGREFTVKYTITF